MRRNIAVILPILAAILIAIILFIRYRRRLDRALSEDSTPTEREHRSASPSEALPWILITVLVIWNAISLSKISALNLKVDNLSSYANALMNQMLSVSSQIDDLEEQRKAETGLLHEYEWSFGEFDGSTGRVRINFTLAPNSYSEKSVFTLQFGEENVQCQPVSAGRYEAAVCLDAFKSVDTAPVVTRTEDGMTKTQILDDVPYGEMWSLVFPGYETEGVDLKASLKNDTLSLKGSFSVGDFSKGGAFLKITKTELVKEVDGREVGRVPLDLEGKNFEPVRIDIDDKFENFSGSSVLRLYLDVKTDSGYSMQTELFRLSAKEGSELQPVNGILEIFDPSGKSVVRTGESIK